jgi:hypothetical protein
MKIKSIPTIYKGTEFKSKLEASYAQTFDLWRIKWIYEVEGYQINDLWYLPDFWLPEMKTFFEVKGPFVSGEQKTEELFKAVGEPVMEDLIRSDEFIFVVIGDELGHLRVPGDPDQRVYLNSCKQCKKNSFVYEFGDYSCRVCGHHDGDHGLKGHTIRIHHIPHKIKSVA